MAEWLDASCYDRDATTIHVLLRYLWTRQRQAHDDRKSINVASSHVSHCRNQWSILQSEYPFLSCLDLKHNLIFHLTQVIHGDLDHRHSSEISLFRLTFAISQWVVQVVVLPLQNSRTYVCVCALLYWNLIFSDVIIIVKRAFVVLAGSEVAFCSLWWKDTISPVDVAHGHKLCLDGNEYRLRQSLVSQT